MNDDGWIGIGLFGLLLIPIAIAALILGIGCLWLAAAM